MKGKAPAPTEAQLKTPNNEVILPQSNHVFCSGLGQFHTNEFDPEKPEKTLTPYAAITFEQIKSMVDSPPYIDKESAQWLIPSSMPSRNFKTQEQDGRYSLLWLDFDDNPPQLSKIKEHLTDIAGGVNFEIYNTRSATADNQKCRVLIPLTQWLNFDKWTLCQQILNDKFAVLDIIPDRASERAAQLCYLPNKGDFYNSISNRDDVFFDPIETFKKEIAQKELAIAQSVQEINTKRKEAEKRKAQLKYTGQAPSNLTGAFNESYTVEDILLQAGYDQRGDKFRHPNSSSGRFTASAKDRRVHSLSSDDPLYSAGNGAHDAFSAFTALEHHGDRNAALVDAGDNYLTIGDVSWNKFKQREYMQAQSHPMANKSSNFSLTQFSLKGHAKEMKEKMLKEVHVMKGIALLGQITVIYAKPNTGKTLLTIHLVKKAIEDRAINGNDVFYINADDSHNGLIDKVALAEQYGFHMLAPAHQGFETKDLTRHMQAMIEQGSAKGAVIVLDTLKKFADLMDKKNASDFMNTARAFSSKGGTLILLAHTNKNRNGEGKVVAGGTSDIIDDADCAFTLDEVSHENCLKSVLFENLKLRGNVSREIGFTYSTADNQSYEERLSSVIALDDGTTREQKEALAIAQSLAEDEPVIDAITKKLGDGEQLKTVLINAVTGMGFPVRKIKATLEKYENKKWCVLSAGRNGKKYRLKSF